eukprot:1552-Heterococcus_DN1.PRE.4
MNSSALSGLSVYQIELVELKLILTKRYASGACSQSAEICALEVEPPCVGSCHSNKSRCQIIQSVASALWRAIAKQSQVDILTVQLCQALDLQPLMLEMHQMFPVHGHASRSASPNLCGFRWSSLSARTPKESSILQTAAAAAAAVATPGVQAKAAEHPQQYPERTLQTYRSTCDFCSSKKLRCSGGATYETILRIRLYMSLPTCSVKKRAGPKPRCKEPARQQQHPQQQQQQHQQKAPQQQLEHQQLQQQQQQQQQYKLPPISALLHETRHCLDTAQHFLICPSFAELSRKRYAAVTAEQYGANIAVAARPYKRSQSDASLTLQSKHNSALYAVISIARSNSDSSSSSSSGSGSSSSSSSSTD